MDSSNFAFVQGVRDTRGALTRWNADPWPVLSAWLLGAGVVTVGLLASVWIIGANSQPDPGSGTILAGFNAPASMADVGRVLFRNSLVLALHALACVAGFIAGSSLPSQAAQQSRRMARVHDHVGRAAIIFVVCATTFSLVTQSLTIGRAASTLSAENDMTVGVLLVGLLPHAIPELMALFLPLAAWMYASRRGDWQDLLAATFVTTALAFPVLIVSAFVEVYVSPHLLLALRG